MQERGTKEMSLEQAPAPARSWPTWSHLLMLLLLALVLHAWVISHTAVIARDTIGYVRYALLLEQQPWMEALPRLEQHPLYPLLVLAMSLPVRHWLGATSPEAMSLSCQLVSAVAGVLLIFPLYFLGRALFDRRVGFWAAALFQCLPVCAQVTSDGLSDGVFLLLLTTSLLLAVGALRHRSPLAFLGCGLAAGLAYLTRPEAVLAVVAVLLVLAVVQAFAAMRWPWRRALTGATGLVFGTLVVAGPYMAIIGGLTVKPAARKLMLNSHPTDTLLQPGETSDRSGEKRAAPVIAGPVLASTLAIWWIDEKRPGEPPLWWGLKVLAQETSHAFHYLAFWPALIGLWWFRDRTRRDPAQWVVLLLCLIISLLLVRLALGVHYLAERHTLILVLCGSMWAAAVLVRAADALPALVARLRRRPVSPRTGSLLTLGCLVLAVGWCMPELLKPLHANRLGHRAAGQWLAEHSQPADRIDDPFCWAHFYAGRVCEEGRVQTDVPPGAHQFVVLTASKNLHLRLSGLDQAKMKVAPSSPAVFRWTPTPQQRKRYHAEEVVIYDVETGGPK